jgi:hypothetical protein
MEFDAAGNRITLIHCIGLLVWVHPSNRLCLSPPLGGEKGFSKITIIISTGGIKVFL